MMRFFILIVSLVCFISACTDTSSTKEKEGTNEVASEPNTPGSYPSISIDRLEYLWNNATYMDVVFYELPVSLNQSTPEQVRSTIAHISEEVPTINPNCKPVGRIFFQVNGVNVEEADIYFENGCTFYLWMKDGKPTHANKFTQAGIDFYNNIYAQVQQMN